MSVKTRFAPSPTGLLHVGNLRTALMAWLFTRHNDGKFLLRLDDTDKVRSKEEYATALQADLKWLGLDWDEFARQSDRVKKYYDAAEELKEDGRLYACYETEEELGLKRKSQLNQGKPPIYDRAALDLSDEQKAKYEAEGRKPHWRFKLNHDEISWHDLVRGDVSFQGSDLSDPILIRGDGSLLYSLCTVVDDIDFGITHVVRGEDHVANTATHVQIIEALGATAPEFAHLPLLTDSDGKGLSKRLGSLGVSHLRDEDGVEPMALLSLLGRLGTSEAIDIIPNLDELVAGFSFDKISRATPRFDHEELGRLNAKLIHSLEFNDVKDRLNEMGLSGIDEAFWNAVKPNLARLDEAKAWWSITHEPIQPVIEDEGFATQAADLLPPEPWDEQSWSAWTKAVKDKTGRKGKNLFMPLRKALTGQDHGPELKNILPLLGYDRVRRRLHGDAV